MSGSHDSSGTEKDLRFGFVLNTSFTIFEFIVGLISGSLALVSDAAHNLTDSLSIVVSYGGQRISNRRADAQHTFGHGGAAVMAALINASILLGLSAFIFLEAFQRFKNPEPVSGGVVAAVAAVGIAVNATVAVRFARRRDNINIRSAFLNMALDALASAGALLAGLLIVLTGESYFDPIISLAIATLLLVSAVNIIKRAAHILLGGVPSAVAIEEVKKAISNQEGVESLDDLHVWSISPEETALSCHVVARTNSPRSADRLLSELKRNLRQDFGVTHATIELRADAGPHDKENTDEGLLGELKINEKL